jgi:hypothetical protein
MASVYVITNGSEVMGGSVSRSAALGYAKLDPGLKVSEVVIPDVLYWMTLPAAKRLAPRGTITEDDAREIRAELSRSDVPMIFAEVVGQIGMRKRESVLRRQRRPRLRAIASSADGPAEFEAAPARVRQPGNVSSLREHAARSPRRRGRLSGRNLPPGPA